MESSSGEETIPITSLTPDTAPPPDKSIRGIVTLSWPYSSSTRQCAFLLADPDFRLRGRKGQVRIRFTGASAEAVAKTRVGIGDEVVLGLLGASWEQDPEATRTPGRSVDGELMFKRRLRLGVVKDGGEMVRLDVDAPASPPPISRQEPDVLATPLPKTVTGLMTDLHGASEGLPRFTYTSPAFMKRARLSGDGFAGPRLDPFEADDDVQQTSEGRWSSFGSSRPWRYRQRTPSPKKTSFEEISDAARESVPGSMLPPSPTLRVTTTQGEVNPGSVAEPTADQTQGPTTPQLRPVVSPTLPLPSPFPVEGNPFQQQLGQGSLEALNSARDAPVIASYEAFRQQYASSQMLPTQTVAPGSSIMDSATATKDNLAQDTQSKLVEEAPQQDLLSPTAPEKAKDDLPLTPARPESPKTKPVAQEDTTTPAQRSNHATPQSDKDKIMAQTFRSLFGFGASQDTAPPDKPKSPSPLLAISNLDGTSMETPDLNYKRQQLDFDGQASQDTAPSDEPKSPSALLAISNLDGSIMETPSSNFERQHFGFDGQASDLPPEPSGLDIAEDSHSVSSAQEQSYLPAPPVLPDRSPLLEPSANQSEIEIIDLGSSSDEETIKEVESKQPPVVSVPQRQVPTLEIQDTFAEADEADLLAELPEVVPLQIPETLSESMDLEIVAEAAPQTLPIHEPEVSPVGELSELVPPTGSHPMSPIVLDSLSPVELKDASFDSPEPPSIDAVQEIPDAPVEIEKAEMIADQPLERQSQSPASQAATAAQLERLEDRSEVLQHTMEEPLYPDLPLSPSDSQSLRAMASQAALPSVIPEMSGNVFPPTPQLTQQESVVQQPVLPQDPADELTATEEQASTLQEAAEEVDAPVAKRTRTRKRKAKSSRVSDVPAVISDWFSPKASDTHAKEAQQTPRRNGFTETEVQQTPTHPPIKEDALTQSEQNQTLNREASGFSTSSAYFTPLAHLGRLLNVSSQQALGSNTVDVFAVVTDQTTEAVRAKSGPRDYFTIFKIADASVPDKANAVRVEVYRPWLATLPVAAVGDVILLRAFAVKSRKRRPYLLSTDASAWCVWRYGEGSAEEGTENDKPVWARKGGGSVNEVITGPPVEFGEEEKKHAEGLREWWLHALRDEQGNGVDEDLDDATTMNGNAAAQVVEAAKL
ncbi:hypothetical protein BDY17DRAFT_297748 [Neohortaea acidophila]|uniref:Telomeric single stranded DNA binding POT1/Cdc13 domain-containing protein n=1 Tax=Neohortaea acidophila TaxID=245834 RepID=A0A6A6PU48_9PEZI|nr:uncharacterized protein BDY17DRAFT_297748 [Neohortaea acidophila]KAF2483628.1 hypothetical protein BDY17DRAFT_297748 [Neohortaea acidophila]